jgi:hypothetical protein
MQRGVIEAVELGSTKDQRQYMRIRVNGEVASLWDEQFYRHLHPGLAIEYNLKKSADGKWWNFSEFRIEGMDVGAEMDSPAIASDRLWDKKSRSFALEYASRIIATSDLTGADDRHKATLRYARDYARYIESGEFPEDVDSG